LIFGLRDHSDKHAFVLIASETATNYKDGHTILIAQKVTATKELTNKELNVLDFLNNGST
jgi:hypothetical protein